MTDAKALCEHEWEGNSSLGPSWCRKCGRIWRRDTQGRSGTARKAPSQSRDDNPSATLISTDAKALGERIRDACDNPSVGTFNFREDVRELLSAYLASEAAREKAEEQNRMLSNAAHHASDRAEAIEQEVDLLTKRAEKAEGEAGRLIAQAADFRGWVKSRVDYHTEQIDQWKLSKINERGQKGTGAQMVEHHKVSVQRCKEMLSGFDNTFAASPTAAAVAEVIEASGGGE